MIDYERLTYPGGVAVAHLDIIMADLKLKMTRIHGAGILCRERTMCIGAGRRDK